MVADMAKRVVPLSVRLLMRIEDIFRVKDTFDLLKSLENLAAKLLL